MFVPYGVNPPFQQVNYGSVFSIPLWSGWDAPQSSKQRKNKHVIFQSSIPCLVLSEFHVWRSVRLMAQAQEFSFHLQTHTLAAEQKPSPHSALTAHLQTAETSNGRPFKSLICLAASVTKGQICDRAFYGSISSRKSTGSLKLSQRSVLPNIIMHCSSKNSSD